MDVTATVDHDGRVLLITHPGLDLSDDTWQLPTGPVLLGETLAVAVVVVAIAVTDPHSICRSARIGRFVHLDVHATGDSEIADIDWPAAITSLDTGQLPCSGGQARMPRLARAWQTAYPSTCATPSPAWTGEHA